MTHGSLYSGIMGWGLAARWAGIENIFTCEIDPFCNKTIDKNFPEIPKENRHHDIKETDFTKYAGRVDILTTSDPCQPFSFAGKRGGKTDDRFLWPETVRVIREVKPSFVVFENVPGFISMAFETVASDLEAEGYTVESFVIPACGVGAWHRRDRLWVVAYSELCTGSGEKRGINGEADGLQEKDREKWSGSGKSVGTGDDEWGKTERVFNEKGMGYGQDVSNTKRQGLQGQSIGQMEESGEFAEGSKNVSNSNGLQGNSNAGEYDTEGRENEGRHFTEYTSDGGSNGTVKCGLGGMVDGLSPWLHEPDIPRVTRGTKNRANRLKSLGNSIVPQIAYLIFEAIKQVKALKE